MFIVQGEKAGDKMFTQAEDRSSETSVKRRKISCKTRSCNL